MLGQTLTWSILKWYATMNNHVSFHTSHVLYRPYQKKKRRKGEKERKERVKILFLNGGTPLHDFCEGHYTHMVLTAMRQVQWPFVWNFICSKTAGICGINLRSTTVVCWRVHSQMGDPSSRVLKKKKRKSFLELSYLNQKFGKAFLQFRFWSGKNHLDGVGWFFVSDG